MAWYDETDGDGPSDEVSGPPTPIFGAPSPDTPTAPPGVPPVGPPPTAPPGVPPVGPPGGPPGGPGYGANAPMGSPQEPPGSGNGSKSTKLVLLAAGVGAVLILAAVLTFTVVGSGPTELSTSKYAKQLCNDVLRPGHREINKIIRSTALKNLDDYESRWNKSRTNDTINGVRELIVTARDITQQIGKFSDGHVLRGRDGEEFREDMAEGVTSAIEDFDDAIADIGELRSEDEEDAIEDLIDIFDNVNGIPIDISDGSPAADIMSALERGRDECYSLMHDLIDY